MEGDNNDRARGTRRVETGPVHGGSMSTPNRVSLSEASRLLGIPEGALRSRIDRGVIPSYSTDGLHVLVDLADIATWGPIWASGLGHNAHRVAIMHREGHADRHIAATLGISHQRVAKIRQRAGLPPISKQAQGNRCLTCGARFAVERRGQNRCPEHRRSAAAVRALTCRECGAPFQRRESTIKATSPGNYCSRACRDQAKRGQSRVDSITKLCSGCGREYIGLPSAKRSVCRLCGGRAAHRATPKKGL